MIGLYSRMLFWSSTTRMRASGIAGRYRDREDGSLPGVAPNIDVAAVFLHDAVDEGQPDAAPLRFGREERFEDVRQVGGVDPVPGVGHPDLDHPALRARGHLQLAALHHRLERVEAEVPAH